MMTRLLWLLVLAIAMAGPTALAGSHRGAGPSPTARRSLSDGRRGSSVARTVRPAERRRPILRRGGGPRRQIRFISPNAAAARAQRIQANLPANR